jgi:hypothetical protein
MIEEIISHLIALIFLVGAHQISLQIDRMIVAVVPIGVVVLVAILVVVFVAVLVAVLVVVLGERARSSI